MGADIYGYKHQIEFHRRDGTQFIIYAVTEDDIAWTFVVFNSTGSLVYEDQEHYADPDEALHQGMRYARDPKNIKEVEK